MTRILVIEDHADLAFGLQTAQTDHVDLVHAGWNLDLDSFHVALAPLHSERRQTA